MNHILSRRVQFSQKILFSLFSLTFAGVDPDGACQVAGRLDQLRPIFPPIGPSTWHSVSISSDEGKSPEKIRALPLVGS